MYHHKYMSKGAISKKECLQRDNGDPCRHFIERDSPKYRNDTNHIARKRGG